MYNKSVIQRNVINHILPDATLLNIFSSQEVQNSGCKHDWQHAGERGRTLVANIWITFFVYILNRHDVKALEEGYLSLVKFGIELLRIGVEAFREDNVGRGLLHRVAFRRIKVIIGCQDGIGFEPSATLLVCVSSCVEVAFAGGILGIEVELFKERRADADHLLFSVSVVRLLRVAGKASELGQTMELFSLAHVGPESIKHIALDMNVMTGRTATLLNLRVILERTVLRHLSV